MPDNDTERYNNTNDSENKNSGLINDPSAKRLFGALLVVALVAIGFGAFNLYNSLKSPFAGKIKLSDALLTEEQQESIDELR